MNNLQFHECRDLDEALPALAEAVQCLKDLKRADIDEVKSLGRPPDRTSTRLNSSHRR